MLAGSGKKIDLARAIVNPKRERPAHVPCYDCVTSLLRQLDALITSATSGLGEATHQSLRCNITLSMTVRALDEGNMHVACCNLMHHPGIVDDLMVIFPRGNKHRPTARGLMHEALDEFGRFTSALDEGYYAGDGTGYYPAHPPLSSPPPQTLHVLDATTSSAGSSPVYKTRTATGAIGKRAKRVCFDLSE